MGRGADVGGRKAWAYGDFMGLGDAVWRNSFD